MTPRLNLRMRVSLVSGSAEPHESLRGVLQRPATVGVHDAEVVQRAGVFLVGRLLEQSDGSLRVLGHPATVGVHNTELPLCAGVPLVSCPFVPFNGESVVLVQVAAALFVPFPEFRLRAHVSLICPLPELGDINLSDVRGGRRPVPRDQWPIAAPFPL